MIKRRTLVEASGILAAGTIAGGWRYYSTEHPSAPQDTGDEPLRLLTARDDSDGGQRRLLIEQWNEAHPDKYAELVVQPGAADLQYTALHEKLQSGDDSFDIVNLDLPWIAEFAAADRLLPLQGADTEGFLKPPLEAGEFGGNLYALPFNTDVGMLYFREGTGLDGGEIGAETAALIRNWDDLRETVQLVFEEGGDFEAGVAMQLSQYEGFTVNVWEYLLGSGIRADQPGGMIDFSADATTAVLERLWDDLYPPEGDRPVILKESLDFEEDDSLERFASGDVPFLRHWPRAYRTLQSRELDFKVGAVPMPGAVLGSQSLAVSASSKRPNAARELIEWLTAPAAQQRLLHCGGFGATREEAYSEAPEDCETDTATGLDTDLLRQAFTGDGASGPPASRPSVDHYTWFSRVFQDFLHSRLEEEATPELGDLQDRLNEAMAGR